MEVLPLACVLAEGEFADKGRCTFKAMLASRTKRRRFWHGLFMLGLVEDVFFMLANGPVSRTVFEHIHLFPGLFSTKPCVHVVQLLHRVFDGIVGH